MRIGELAKAANCSVETIRYYEQQKLIPAPYRTENNYRIYNESHLTRLKFIRNCRSLDMTHEEIRELLKLQDMSAQDCTSVSCILETHIQHVQHRIIELEQLKQQLTALRLRCDDNASVNHCGIIQELADMNVSETGHKTHLS